MGHNRYKRTSKHQKQSNSNKRQHQKASPANSDTNHELIFDLSRQRVANQLEQSNQLNNRAYLVIGAATALITTAPLVQGVLLPSYCTTLFDKVLQEVPMLFLLLACLETWIFAYLGWRIQKYWTDPNPEALYAFYLGETEQLTKDEITKYLVKAYSGTTTLSGGGLVN